MATVIGKTSMKIDDLVNAQIVDGTVAPNGHLLLTTRGGAIIDSGPITKPFGILWSSIAAYTVGDMVGYAGCLWKCVQDGTNKSPALNTTYWVPISGRDPNSWADMDPLFTGDDLAEAWQLFWTTGTVVSSFASGAGQFETGIKSLKLTMGSSSTQRFYEHDENIVYGGEVVTVKVRAKLNAAAAGVTILATLTQNDSAGKPEPFETGAVGEDGVEGAQTLTTSWQTFTFTCTAANAKPRALMHYIVQTTGAAAVVLIDRTHIDRIPKQEVVRGLSTDRTGSHPSAGQFYFETDTDDLYLYDGAAWQGPWMLPDPTAVTMVGYTQRTSATTATASEFNIATVTIPNPINGAVYKVTGMGNFNNSLVGDFTDLHLKCGTAAVTGGTQFAGSYIDNRASNRTQGATVIGYFTYTGTTGAASFNVVFTAVAGTTGLVSCQGSATRPATLLVERIA